MLFILFLCVRWKLYPRVLRDVSVMDLSTSVLGQRISMPVCVGATAMQRMAHADGETATAKGEQRQSPLHQGRDEQSDAGLLAVKPGWVS